MAPSLLHPIASELHESLRGCGQRQAQVVVAQLFQRDRLAQHDVEALTIDLKVQAHGLGRAAVRAGENLKHPHAWRLVMAGTDTQRRHVGGW